MKLRWGKHSLTFMIIPDANRKVVRFRISTMLLYAVPLIMLSIVCAALLVHLNSVKTALEKERLASELASKQQQYEQAIGEKDATISELQSEIVDISEQTEDMKLKVGELKQLEEELRGVAPQSETTDNAASKGKVSIASIPSAKLTMDRTGGMGGGADELSAGDTRTLIASTRDVLSNLDLTTTELIDSITKSRDALLEHLHMLRITPSIWPVASRDISSNFGYRRDPFTRKAAAHEGMDIAANTGDPIHASAEGVVTYVGYDRASYGYNVIIKHASGLKTRYGHMKKYIVKEGQTIKQGELIGYVGSTGRSTGPHLHYEVIKNGVPIDPTPYLNLAGED